MAPLIKRRRVLAAKIETTVGTAETLIAADAAHNVFDGMMQSEIEYHERESQGGFLALPGVMGAYGGTCTFMCELTSASGTSPSWAETFLPACGFTQSIDTWTASSLPPEAAGSATKTLTIGMYTDGVLKRLRGCMGNFIITCADGDRAKIEFTFTGLWESPQDAANLVPTYPTAIPMKFQNSTFTIGGAAPPPVQQIVIDAGNEVVLREDGTNVSGYHSAVITNRKTVGSINPEAVLVATDAPYADMLAGTEAAFSLALTDPSADTLTISAATAQYKSVQEADRNGIQTDEIEIAFNDDNLTLVWS